jgi:hypothetical protein
VTTSTTAYGLSLLLCLGLFAEAIGVLGAVRGWGGCVCERMGWREDGVRGWGGCERMGW